MFFLKLDNNLIEDAALWLLAEVITTGPCRWLDYAVLQIIRFDLKTAILPNSQQNRWFHNFN